MSGIYVHIPFCHKACSYCNFHFSTSLKMKDELIDALLKEIDLRKDYLEQKELQTIYFGGGTPSILNESDLTLIFEKIKANFSFDDKTEITLEANPEDITKEKLKIWKSMGINRLSIGVQSFDANELKFMNRNHDHHQSVSALHMAKEMGYNNLSADLIFGLPGSSAKLWISNLQQMIGFQIPHLSCYALTIEEHTALHHQLKTRKIKILPDENVSTQFMITHDFLSCEGFEHYEISNYALPQQQAIHNSNYWNSKSYLGIGPAAHSFDGNSRQWNVANNKKYIRALHDDTNFYQKETLSQNDRFNEYLMTSLRTAKGIKLEKVKSFGEKYLTHLYDKIQSLQKQGVLVSNKDRLALTPKAMLLSDQIISDLFY